MQVTDAMVAKAAESDAAFDGRTWLAMPKSERERYMERSRRSLTAAMAELWRPIEEAPKDGTRVLTRGLLDPIPGQCELYYGLDIPTTTACYWDQVDEAWCIVGATWLGPFFRPTNFMPLPTPPRGK